MRCFRRLRRVGVAAGDDGARGDKHGSVSCLCAEESTETKPPLPAIGFDLNEASGGSNKRFIFMGDVVLVGLCSCANVERFCGIAVVLGLVIEAVCQSESRNKPHLQVAYGSSNSRTLVTLW